MTPFTLSFTGRLGCYGSLGVFGFLKAIGPFEIGGQFKLCQWGWFRPVPAGLVSSFRAKPGNGW
jgi:hypothetical protein